MVLFLGGPEQGLASKIDFSKFVYLLNNVKLICVLQGLLHVKPNKAGALILCAQSL